MADNENYIENIQFGEDEEIYPIRDAEAHEEIDEVKEDYVEKEGGELADTIVTYEDEETTVSSFTDFISNFISGSKVAKWFKDFRAGVEYILHVGSLVNNCVTNNTNLPLAAAQGKALQDQITDLSNSLSEQIKNVEDIENELKNRVSFVNMNSNTITSLDDFVDATTPNGILGAFFRIMDNYNVLQTAEASWKQGIVWYQNTNSSSSNAHATVLVRDQGDYETLWCQYIGLTKGNHNLIAYKVELSRN